jgi:pimeloyl-ACP methyl ester carboxylesterase
MPFANSELATIHYEVRGDGPETLLLIMGLGGHASEWGDPFLSPLAAKYRVVTMDNRGIGESTHESEAWTMLDMAHDAGAVLDALGVEHAFVGGTSMGGMVAQTLAIEQPERVARLVLMSTSFGGREPAPPEPDAAAALLPVKDVPLAELHRRALKVLTGPGFADSRRELIDALADERQRVPTRGRVFKAQFGAIVADDRSQRVRQLQLPTLVVHGDQDPLIPVENGKLLAARIPGARFVLLEGCGHFPHFERPVETSNAILEFLSER